MGDIKVVVQKGLQAAEGLNTSFFHGCKNSVDLKSIERQGFRGEFFDEDGRWLRDGNLGRGIYLSCDWRTALWFGPILLEARLVAGTKILDASPPADRAVLDQVSREFGHTLLKNGDIKGELPRNKQLDLDQLIALTRHFYHLVWDKDWKSEKSWKVSAKDRRYRIALDRCVSHLKRYGFHGYGHPSDDNGIVIFAPDRIKLIRVVRALDFVQHNRIVGSQSPDELLRDVSLDDFERMKIPNDYSKVLPKLGL